VGNEGGGGGRRDRESEDTWLRDGNRDVRCEPDQHDRTATKRRLG
jgi:hypothetical protein